MQRLRHTTIDELPAFGHEPAEEHLVLAAGGALNLRVPPPRTVKRYVTNGQTRLDEEYDW